MGFNIIHSKHHNIKIVNKSLKMWQTYVLEWHSTRKNYAHYQNDLKEIGWEGIDWTHMAQDMGKF